MHQSVLNWQHNWWQQPWSCMQLLPAKWDMGMELCLYFCIGICGSELLMIYLFHQSGLLCLTTFCPFQLLLLMMESPHWECPSGEDTWSHQQLVNGSVYQMLLFSQKQHRTKQALALLQTHTTQPVFPHIHSLPQFHHPPFAKCLLFILFSFSCLNLKQKIWNVCPHIQWKIYFLCCYIIITLLCRVCRQHAAT